MDFLNTPYVAHAYPPQPPTLSCTHIYHKGVIKHILNIFFTPWNQTFTIYLQNERNVEEWKSAIRGSSFQGYGCEEREATY